jgi:hypothetical protein
MPSLVGDYAAFRAETARLTALLASTNSLAPKHRKYIAEIALLRLAILIENSMKSVFCKLSCGATYINGAAPVVLAQQRNIPGAVEAMRKHGRAKLRYRLPWNDGGEIRENIRYVIDPSDRCHADLITHASFLSDVRYIRNHVAHRNDNSRANFVKLIRRYYGARVPGVTCGNLLVSPRVSKTRPLLETYIINANVMMKDIVRG